MDCYIVIANTVAGLFGTTERCGCHIYTHTVINGYLHTHPAYTHPHTDSYLDPLANLHS